MSMICSKVKSVDNLYLDQLPAGRIVKVVKAVRVNDITVYVGESGRLYCDRLQKVAYVVTKWPWNDSLMRALVKLGVITDKEMKEHLELCEAAYIEKDKEWIWRRLSEAAGEYGFKVTAEQKKKLCPIRR